MSDNAEEIEYSLLNRYPTGGCNLHDWTMIYNVSTSLDTTACRSVVASKSSPNRKVANESQSFYPVTTANATTVQLPIGHVGCRTSTSEKEDETGWKIIHRCELCGTERRQRIMLRLLQLHHDSRRVHVILHSQKRPHSSPRVTTQLQGTASRTRVERSGQVFLLVNTVDSVQSFICNYSKSNLPKFRYRFLFWDSKTLREHNIGNKSIWY
jgi:hypothetical protein